MNAARRWPAASDGFVSDPASRGEAGCAPSQPRVAAVPDMAQAYDRYFATGAYAARYEGVNAFVWDRVVHHLRAVDADAPRVLDFGCGDGRYALPLLRETSARVTAYDISHEALRQLSMRAVAARCDLARLDVLHGAVDDPLAGVEPASFDVACLLFGVLGHVRGRANRIALLDRVRSRLVPGGALICSVPSRLRRLRTEQRATPTGTRLEAGLEAGSGAGLEAGDVLYRRASDEGPIDLFYHVFTPAEAAGELRDAGFAVAASAPESVLPEVGATATAPGRLLERLLRPVTPLSLGYGFLLEARA